MSESMGDTVWVMEGCRGDDQYRFRKTLPAEGELVLGRRKDSFVPLASPYASRHHLKLSVKREICRVTCLGTQNGTFRNGSKMVPHETVLIEHKDKIMVGNELEPQSCFSLSMLKERIDKENEKSGKDGQVADVRTKVTDSDWKLNQEVDVVIEPLSADRVAKLMPVAQQMLLAAHSDPHVVTIDSDHSDHSPPSHTSSNLTSRPQNHKSVPMSGLSNKRKQSAVDSETFLKPEKRLKTAAPAPVKVFRTTTSTVTRTSNAAPLSTTSSARPKVRDTLSTITPSKRVDVLSDILGPVTKPPAVKIPRIVGQKGSNFMEKYHNFMETERKKSKLPPAAPPKPKTMTLIDPAPLTAGVRQGYVTAAARLAERNQRRELTHRSPPRSFSPTETAGAPANRIQRVAHQVAPAATRPPVTVTTTAALMMKNPVPAETAVRTMPQRLVAPPKLNVDVHLSEILSWNVNWFKEANKIAEEPVLSNTALMSLKTSYDSHKEYADTYIPYVLHEIWTNLLEAYQKNSKTGAAQTEIFKAHITHISGSGCFSQMQVEWPIREKVRIPAEGDMLMLDIATNDTYPHNNAPVKFIGLGFITNSMPETRFNPAEKPYPIPPGCQKILSMTIIMKKTQHDIDLQQMVQVMRLDYIKPHLKHIEAVLLLEYHKLLPYVLKPNPMTCQIPFPRDDNLGNAKYNKSQHEAILGSAEGVKRGRTVAKIMMVQGPPGTGKTHTLVGIVKEIYNTWHPWNKDALPKLLVCAPSNGAVDEIGKRLYHERHFLNHKDKSRSLRCVRMGLEENVKSECQHITLDKLVEENMRRGSGYEEKINNLEQEMARLDIEISNHKHRNQFTEAKKCEEELELKSQHLNRLRISKTASGTDKQQERALREDILKRADIILTTLNSCRASNLVSMFNSTNAQMQFDGVIIDEASQCTEPELLMPLCYSSITKVIMIGDPMQLPATVKSKKGNAAGYGTSLFERFFKYFGGYNDQTPVHTLNTQFRMHYDICKFPSATFYDHRLLTQPNSGTDRHFPLKPYTVFDLKGTSHSSEDPRNIFNPNEAAFIIKLCVLLNKILPQMKTVGIITPYRGQMRLIRDKLLNERNFSIRIDVNTIDGFQGQERDVIIFSSVRSSEGVGGVGFLGSAQRMNVALTRAKFGLIVCLSKKSLEGSDVWNKLIEDAESRLLLKTVAYTATEETIRQLIVHPDVQNLRN